MHLSADPGGKKPFRLKDETSGKGKKKNGPSSSLPLKEGLNVLKRPGPDGKSTREIKIYADSTPPKTKGIFTGAPFHQSKTGSEITQDINLTNEKIIKQETNRYYGKGVVFTLSASDSLAGVNNIYLSVNGGPFKPSGGFSEFEPDVVTNLRYYSVDNVGNVENVHETDFYVDTASPASRLEIKGDNRGPVLSPRCKISLSSADRLSGVKSIFYKIDDQPVKPFRKDIKASGVKEGPHTLTYFAEDHTGNVEEENTYSFFYDKSPPGLTMSILGDRHEHDKVVFVSPKSLVKIETRDNKAGTGRVDYHIKEQIPARYSAPFPLPKISGLHKIEYSAIDEVRNESETESRRFYLDLTPPETEFKIGGYYIEKELIEKNNHTSGTGTTGKPAKAKKVKKAFIIRKEVKLILTASDLEAGVKEIRYTIDNGEQQLYDKPLTFETDGEYCLTYYAVDHVNNIENKKKLQLIVDNSPLQTGFQVPPVKFPKQWFKNNDGRLMGSVNHPFFLQLSPDKNFTGNGKGDAGPVFFLDLKKLLDESGQAVTFKKQGVNYLHIPRGKNGKQGDTFQVLIDSLPPVSGPDFSGAQRYVAPPTGQNGKTIFYGPGLTLRFSGKDRAGKRKSKTGPNLVSGFNQVFVSIDGSEFFTYASPLKIFSREKIYKCSYYAVDNVGNAEKVKNLQFTVDTTPPSTRREITGLKSGRILSSRSVISLSAEDNSSGVRGIYYGFDGNAPKPYRGAIGAARFKRLKDGEHRLVFYAVDNVGNKEKSRKISFYMDHGGPRVILKVKGDQYEEHNTIYVSGRSRVSLTAVDRKTDVESIRYRIGGNETKEYEHPFPLQGPDRAYSLRYTGIDSVGNTGKGQTQRFVLDKLPPETDFKFDGPVFRDRFSQYISPGTKIQLTAADTGAGIETVYYKLDSGKLKHYSMPFQITAPGVHTIKYYAADRVKNTEKQKQFKVYVDNQPPELQVKYNVSPMRTRDKNILEFPDYLLVSLLADDANTEVDRIIYRLNSGQEKLYRNPLSSFEPGKIYRLWVAAYDRVGNKTETKVTFRVR